MKKQAVNEELTVALDNLKYATGAFILFNLSILLHLAAFFVLGTVFSIPIMLVWNWLMPDIFGLPTIGVFQAFGLAFLSNVFFGSNVVPSLLVPKKKG